MPQQRPIRAHVDIEVGADLVSGDVAVVRNVSLSGCLLVTRAKLKLSQQVSLTVPRPGGDLHVTGRVVRRQGDGASGWDEYGIRFDPLNLEERRELALVVAEGVERAPSAGVDVA